MTTLLDGYDALFIGGNDEWKFSEEAYAWAGAR